MGIRKIAPTAMARFIADARDILMDRRRDILRAATAHLNNSSDLSLLNVRQKLCEDLAREMLYSGQGHHTDAEQQRAEEALHQIVDRHIATTCREFPEMCYTNPYWLQSKNNYSDTLGYMLDDVAIRDYLHVNGKEPF